MSKRSKSSLSGQSQSLDGFFARDQTTPSRDSVDTPLHVPLAERQRPSVLSEFIFDRFSAPANLSWLMGRLDAGRPVPSVILSGPPGCGKTTLAVIASKVMSQYRFVRLSAVSDGVADVRKALADKRPTLLFIDEIHRFTKNQQDALLHSVESGHVVLIGATSESPSTCINKALLSRCKVVSIPSMKPENIAHVVSRALSGCVNPPDSDVIAYIIQQSAGDARRALNMLEEVLEGESGAHTSEYAYDSHKRSEYISAFQKSIRGSDKDAAIFYMVAMLESGEDPMYIARRVVRIASEDVGMADPSAMNICVSAMLATQSTGMPECNTALGLAVAYLCDCPKSNAIELACLNAKRIFESHKQSFTVPSYIRPSAVGYIYTNQPEVVPPPAVKRQRYLPSGIIEPIYPRIS